MNTNIDNFIVSTTTEFWATVYKKRKMARKWPDHNEQQLFNDLYDPAAEINQLQPLFCHGQDQMVKQIFRELVDYITKVLALILKIRIQFVFRELRIRNHFS